MCSLCLERVPLAPPCCFRCKLASNDFKTCQSCKPFSALDRVFIAAAYQNEAKQLVQDLKFERKRAAATVLAHLMAEKLPQAEDWLIIHVPTATSRVRQRGYDHAQLIAKYIARQTHSPSASLLLRHGQQRQVGKTRLQRQAQMTQAFSVLRAHKIQGKHILLVDDVITTGSTLSAAASTLRAAGAAQIDAVVFAAA